MLAKAIMLFISTTHRPATDLGFLLHKNPNRVHVSNLAFGKSYLFYPEASEAKAVAALTLDIDPVGLVRGKGHARGSLAEYVNDRPYVASSFLSVAIAAVLGTAMAGRSKERPELVDKPLPLEIEIPVLPCRSHPDRIRRLFEPLGYQVECERLPLDFLFPEWGESPYFRVLLSGNITVRDALRQLYLLLPVLDAKKHYYMDSKEVEKILQKGEGWLEGHPERDWILRSSLGRTPSLLREALEQLTNAEEALLADAAATEDSLSGPDLGCYKAWRGQPPINVSLHRQRHEKLVALIRQLRPSSVLDLGCGEGKLMQSLIPVQGIERIVGMDVSIFALERASKALRLDEATPRFAERVQLIHGSLMYRDDRLKGFDLCAVVEVIEHLDPPRLDAFESVVFGHAQPNVVLVTTPNREYNAVYEVEEMRHEDHRFEWDREEFREWASRVGSRFGYSVMCEGIGDEHELHGPPSQMAVFRR